MLPSLAEAILGYSLVFMLAAICVAMGMIVLALVPIAILKLLEECRYISRTDANRIMAKLKLRKIDDAGE